MKLGSELTQHLPATFFGLPEVQEDCEEPTPDVLVIGTQENSCAGQWIELLQRFLAPLGYSMLPGGASMQSSPGGSFCMTVAAFVQQELKTWVTDVKVSRVTCGMGNKVCSVLQPYLARRNLLSLQHLCNST